MIATVHCLHDGHVHGKWLVVLCGATEGAAGRDYEYSIFSGTGDPAGWA